MGIESEQQHMRKDLPRGRGRLMIGWGLLMVFYPFLLPFTPFAADIVYIVLCVVFFAAAFKLGLMSKRIPDVSRPASLPQPRRTAKTAKTGTASDNSDD